MHTWEIVIQIINKNRFATRRILHRIEEPNSQIAEAKIATEWIKQLQFFTEYVDLSTFRYHSRVPFGNRAIHFARLAETSVPNTYAVRSLVSMN